MTSLFRVRALVTNKWFYVWKITSIARFIFSRWVHSLSFTYRRQTKWKLCVLPLDKKVAFCTRGKIPMNIEKKEPLCEYVTMLQRYCIDKSNSYCISWQKYMNVPQSIWSCFYHSCNGLQRHCDTVWHLFTFGHVCHGVLNTSWCFRFGVTM